VEFFIDAFRWLTDPANYAMDSGSPLPIQARVGEHLWYTFISVVIAALMALPLGLYIGHTGRGRQFVIGFTGAMRALPTLGLLMAYSSLLAPRFLSPRPHSWRRSLPW
jgi:osmoprotectant transport system permease protein